MPRFSAPRPATAPALLAVALLAVLAGCDAPPGLNESTLGPSPSPTGLPTGGTAALPPGGSPTLPPGPTPAGQSGQAAAPCTAGPSAKQLLTFLRGSHGLLPQGVTATVRTGPLCADGWQYSQVDVTGHESLQVVTRGEPGALTLVTAGTDVCTIAVRVTAPEGVRRLACDGPQGGAA